MMTMVYAGGEYKNSTISTARLKHCCHFQLLYLFLFNTIVCSAEMMAYGKNVSMKEEFQPKMWVNLKLFPALLVIFSDC